MPFSPKTPVAKESIATETLPAEPLDGRYRLETVIGRGGMGTVYRALDLRLNRLVAVKILRDAHDADISRFQAEIETLARLTHPGLVRVLDAGGLDANPYLVMDLIDGANLAQRLSEGPLSLHDTAKIGASIATALAYVHDAGIVHRDVKPANVLIDRQGEAHLADFGIARLADTTGLTATGMTLGTPAYLAPEQIEGSEVGPSCDVYSLGLVLIECLSGRRAFEGTAAEITGARLHRDPDIPGGLGETWRQVLSSMTARSPRDRIGARHAAARLRVLALDDDLDATVPFLMPLGGDPSVTMPIVPIDTRPLEQVPTRHYGASAPGDIRAKERRTSRVTRRGALTIAIGAVVVILVVSLALAGVLPGTHSPVTRAVRPGANSTTSTVTTTSTTTTTTLASPVVTAAGAVTSAIANGVAVGSLSTQEADQLTNQLQPLLVATPSPPSQQIQQFNQLAQLFTQGVQSGAITGSSTVSSLTGALDGLASALGVTVTSVTPTTAPVGPGGPGNGHGHGHGNGQ